MRRQCEAIEDVLDSQDDVLPPVEFVGHRRGRHASASVQVPQRLPRGGIQSQQVAGIIGAKEEMAGTCKNSCDAFAVSDFVIPHYFAGTVVKRAKR